MSEERYKLNKENIQKEILLKNSNVPYIVENSIYNVENDMDIFPYPRWFQSIPTNDTPFIIEREAGWKAKNVDYLKKSHIKKPPLRDSNLCFQAACSIVYPCYSQDNSYININKACINEYK